MSHLDIVINEGVLRVYVADTSLDVLVTPLVAIQAIHRTPQGDTLVFIANASVPLQLDVIAHTSLCAAYAKAMAVAPASRIGF